METRVQKDVQSLDSLKSLLNKWLNVEGVKSLSTIYRRSRALPQLDMIGSYPILSYILFELSQDYPDFKISRGSLMRTIKVSGFFRDEGKAQAYVPTEFERYINSESILTRSKKTGNLVGNFESNLTQD